MGLHARHIHLGVIDSHFNVRLELLGSKKNDNLWKSFEGIVVNGAPREVPRGRDSNAHWGSPFINYQGMKQGKSC